MIKLAGEAECTGCSACFNICPTGSIEMKYDEQGFLFPFIDRQQCCACGKCMDICPVLQDAVNYHTPVGFWAAWSKDMKTLRSSTSGGMFLSLSRYVFSHNGAVAGVRFDKDMHLIHDIAYSESEACAMQGSKYIQSNVGHAYRKVKKLLNSQVLVMFTGTPCQIDGLYSYLGKEYENLITCEVLCHGVGSTKFFEDVIKDYQSGSSSEAEYVLFRDKKHGWEDSSFTIGFLNGRRKSLPSYYNTFGYPFSRGQISRLSCLNCKYSSTNRVADITLGDYAGKDKEQYSSKQRKMGISLVLASTEKGRRILEGLEDTVVYDKKDIADISESNPALRKRNHSKERRNEFFDIYLKEGYDAVKMKFASPSREVVLRYKYRRQINAVYNILKKILRR